MFLSKAILLALTLMVSVNAAVLKIRNPLERRGTQSCHCTTHGWYESYSVLIRVPYIGKSDCDATYNAFEYGSPFVNNQHEWNSVPISNRLISQISPIFEKISEISPTPFSDKPLAKYLK